MKMGRRSEKQREQQREQQPAGLLQQREQQPVLQQPVLRWEEQLLLIK